MAESLQKVGLALGGGGLWGLSEFGVVDVLQQEGVPVRAIAGASMGAIVGGVTATCVDDEGNLQRGPVQQMIDFAQRVETLDQITELRDGQVRLAFGRLLGGSAEVFGRPLKVPLWTQVARHRKSFGKQHEQFLAVAAGTPLHEALPAMEASAAIKPKFGISPVTIGNETYSDDTSIAWKSTSAVTRVLRQNGATAVIGVPVGFIDTPHTGRPLQRLLDFLSRFTPSTFADRGDVVVRPKDARGSLFHGRRMLTNFGRGILARTKYARNQDDLAAGKRVPLPVAEFIEEGRRAALQAMPAINALLGRA